MNADDTVLNYNKNLEGGVLKDEINLCNAERQIAVPANSQAEIPVSFQGPGLMVIEILRILIKRRCPMAVWCPIIIFPGKSI